MGVSPDGINGHVSMNLNAGGHRLWFDLGGWDPLGLLSQDTLFMNEFLSGFQSKHMED